MWGRRASKRIAHKTGWTNKRRLRWIWADLIRYIDSMS